MDLPYLTTEFPGVGGIIKERVEDFFVQEIPLYEASESGEHTYCEIQKVNLTTFDAINSIGRALNVSTRDIGYAGLKDARAVSRQLVSIWGTTPEAVMALKLPDISVLWASRHGNKLRLGHLKGNRFAIKIRHVNPADVVKLQAPLEVLKKRGMPNYFGEQRFGRRGENHLLGAALLAGDDERVLKLLLGSPKPDIDDSQSGGARKAFERGEYEPAMKLWPRSCGMERRVLARFIKTGNATAAARAIDEKLRRLWVSALQSELFNRVLSRRINQIDRILPGDIAMKEENGACFMVEDPAVDQPRAEAFEISPTGPLLGYRMTLPASEALGIEQAIFDEFGLKPEHFRVEGQHKVKGARRPLRVRPDAVDLASGVDEHGEHITVAFTLPAGSFATVLLRELMKSD